MNILLSILTSLNMNVSYGQKCLFDSDCGWGEQCVKYSQIEAGICMPKGK